MRKHAYLSLCVLLALLCGCEGAKGDITQTRFLLDTVVTVTADCDEETLSGAFKLCEKYEKTLSAHIADSEIARLNETGEAELSPDTADFLRAAAGYCAVTGGRLDITVYPLTALWNFKNETVPSKAEIAEALKNVDYNAVTVEGNRAKTGGKKIDPGAVAKGYITDRVLEYLKENGATAGIINLGGNVYVFGDKEYKVGIQKPFEEGKNSAVIKLKNKTASTSGIYQRYFEKNGVMYHHVIDPATGRPAETDLYSATVIDENSARADAFSTACVILGRDAAAAFIESQPGIEAVFIDKNYGVSYTSGIKRQGNFLILEK